MSPQLWNIFLLLVIFGVIGIQQVGSVAFCKSSDDDNCEKPLSDQARYDNYRVYYVTLATQQHVEIFQQLKAQSDSYIFFGSARHIKQQLRIMVAAHKVADFADLLKTYDVKHRILTYNFQAKIDENLKEVLPKDVDLKKFDWQHYFHLETIYAWMEEKALQHKELTVLDMGLSVQGLPIKGLKLERNKGNKAIFIESGIHAREWVTPATATYIIDQLLNSTDASVKRLADEYNWIVFPVINPDGYKYSFDADRLWRKNRARCGICRGVDLNRNYPNHWNTTGSSGDPCHSNYAGPSAASEAETQRLIKFLEDHVESEQIKTYLSLHSYSQLIMFPYAHTATRVENYDDLKAIAKKASKRIRAVSGRIYKIGSIYETIYPSSGSSKDWAYEQLQIPIIFTFELRGPPDSDDMYVLPAAEIMPTAAEAFAAILTIVEEAEARGYYE